MTKVCTQYRFTWEIFRRPIGIMWAQPGTMGWNVAEVVMELVCVVWDPLRQPSRFLGATGQGERGLGHS